MKTMAQLMPYLRLVLQISHQEAVVIINALGGGGVRGKHACEVLSSSLRARRRAATRVRGRRRVEEPRCRSATVPAMKEAMVATK